MNRDTRADGKGLNPGGPGDTPSPGKQQGQSTEQGSQSGRVQHQGPQMPEREGGEASQRPRDLPQDSTAEDERGLSDTERRAGSPDPHATTDSGYGDSAG